MYIKIIGFLHFIFAIFISTYGLFIKKNKYDNLYLFYIILLIISWTFYNGECLISYYTKKNNDKDYVAGTETSDLQDIYEIFGKNSKNIIDNIIIFSLMSNVISQYIVFSRNEYPDIISISVPFIYITYCIMLRIKYSNLNFIQDIYKIVSIIIFLFMLNKEKIIKIN